MLTRAPKDNLSVETGGLSAAGQKAANQDFHGLILPEGPARALKGVALAIADGISPSPVSAVAAETAVKTFLTDYYCTSDAWSVATAGSRVIAATNSWLFSRTRQAASPDLGHVCTFSALVLKGRKAHLFHVGDSRIWRLSGRSLEQLTDDHRVVLSEDQSRLSRALGHAPAVEIDHRAFDLMPGDVFVMTTDGVHDVLAPGTIAGHIAEAASLQEAAHAILEAALGAGSTDNLTIQIVRVTGLAAPDAVEVLGGDLVLPPAAVPQSLGSFEGFRLLRALHASHRSHIFLAENEATGARVALKFPSSEMREDTACLRRFALEEWIARRLNSPHVLKAADLPRDRMSLFVASEYVEGQTLRQWMLDNPSPSLEAVRGIVEQIARGLQAFHRKDMIHQDLRPENIMIDASGTVKIIDFGSVRIAGVIEAAPALDTGDVLGTHQYTAPEVLIGYLGTERSDLFSLGVIAYEMLTGRLPYGTAVGRVSREKDLDRLRYRSAAGPTGRVPDWVDHALARAVHPHPGKRPDALSVFLADLRRPGPGSRPSAFVPLAERDPVRFWQAVAGGLAVVCAILFFQLFSNP